MSPEASPTAPHYAAGEIERRLKGIRDRSARKPREPDLSPWRSAAAVLVAFDPAKLKPNGPATEGSGGLGLLPELVPATGLGSRDEPLWALPAGARKAELRRLATQEKIAAALAANPERSRSPFQRMFDRVVAGPPLPPVAELTNDDLAALLVVVDWLEGVPISPAPPDLGKVRAKLESSQDLDRLRRLAGDVFVGRADELARLRAHLFGTDREILFVAGTGGAGKSALLARALLQLSDETKDPACWVRVDIADGNVIAKDPISVLIQAARQLGRRDTTLEHIVVGFVGEAESRLRSLDYGGLESSTSLPEDNIEWAIGRFKEIIKRYQAKKKRRVFAFCVDSFEEAQLLGEPVAKPLLDVLARLAAATVSRVIVCGRAGPPGSTLFTPQASAAGPRSEVRVEALPLADLPPADAAALLDRAVRQEKPDARLKADTLEHVTAALGGNPLTLKLAAHLINIKGPNALGDPLALKDLKAEATQARLYSRVLGHIDDKDVQRLAIPGLVVRVIDKDVIRDVLARPCGLGEVGTKRAADLIEKLAREITLVERLPGDVLRHRPDIRRVMLDGVPDEMRDQVTEIHRRAVEHWHKLPGAQARAEEIYHMLLLGEGQAELGARWSDDIAVDLQGALSGALEELPPGSPPRVWLAEKLGVTLPEGERATIAVEQRESQAERAATQFLAHGDAGRALAVLEAQEPFTAGSRLFGLQARVLFRLGRTDDALAKTDAGIESVRRSGDEAELVALLLLRAYVLESEGRETEALAVLERSDAERTTRLARLRVNVRRARLLRKLNRDAPALRTELIRQTVAQERDIARHPALLRELAAEIGGANPALLGRALEVFGRELFGEETADELKAMLVGIGAVSRDDLATFAGVSHLNLVELVHTNLDQLIYGTDERARAASRMFVEVLRRSVNGALQQAYRPPAPVGLSSPEPHPPGHLTAAPRQKLVDVLVNGVPMDQLRRIARYNLDLDLERLGGNLAQHEVVAELVDAAESRGLLEPFLQGVLANVSGGASAEVRSIIEEARNPLLPATVTEPLKGATMSDPVTPPGVNGLLNHYKRIAAGRGGRSPYESVGAAESPQERAESTKDALLRIVKDYLKNDSRLIEVANKIAADGGEALRMLDANDEQALRRRPEVIAGLEAIVRTDGSRPSFLITNGEIDRNSSPIGDWAGLLDRSAERLRGAIACVGRIDVPGTSVGFQGTGFLIQENLILTNRHVLQVSARQINGEWRFFEGAAIDFGHEFNGRDSVNRRRLKRVVFCGDKPIVFDSIDHAKLDLALIELEPAAGARPPAALPLNLSAGWAAPGTTILTIGYPGSPPTMLYAPTLVEQLFQSTFGYKRIAPGEVIPSQLNVQPWTLAHDATTLGGNSGSIVLVADNEQTAAGLHYGGRGVEPRENWGHVLASVLNSTDGTSSKTLQDVLRELGVRLSEGSAPPAPTAQPPRGNAPPVAPAAPAGQPAPRPPAVGAPRKPGDWRQGVTLAMMRPLGAVPGKSRLEAFLEAPGDGHTAAEALADREGYDPNFLADFPIPLPMPAGDVRRLRRGGDGVELKYEHFSVVMSASRRMPTITACNIDGSQSRRLPRIQQWSYDGRLDDGDQFGNELYVGNELDRGHMVRREDPVWGPLASARRANADTFHYTNSCPQMAGVNQRIWLGLEDYVLRHTREDEMRVSVFTGPFFSPNDRPYRGALIPLAFWKVVAFLLPDGRPSATAYKVSQSRELQELEFVFAQYQTFQISVQQVMDATNIDFGALLPFDGFSEHERVHAVPIVERLKSFDQIRV